MCHANLWGEDGWVWYPDAYNRGWQSLLLPWSGYLQTASRLVALATLPFPLAWVPTLFAGAAILAQACVAAFMVSDRLAVLCPTRPIRYLFALLYALQPNTYETFANLTNLQWHLGLLSFLVVISAPPKRPIGWALDCTVLLISGLSGPLCIFITPIAGWRALMSRERVSFTCAAIVFASAAIQLWCMFGPEAQRGAPHLGAGPIRLARIVSLQIVLALLFGRHTMPLYLEWSSWRDGVLPLCVAGGAFLLTLRTMWTGPPIVRLACVFGGLVLASALVRPTGSPSEIAWEILAIPDNDTRYFFLPALAWAAVLFTLAGDRNAVFRWIARALLLIALLMLPGDWRLPKTFPLREPTDFVQKARAFAIAPPGTVMTFPVQPFLGHPMTLRKTP